MSTRCARPDVRTYFWTSLTPSTRCNKTLDASVSHPPSRACVTKRENRPGAQLRFLWRSQARGCWRTPALRPRRLVRIDFGAAAEIKRHENLNLLGTRDRGELTSFVRCDLLEPKLRYRACASRMNAALSSRARPNPSPRASSSSCRRSCRPTPRPRADGRTYIRLSSTTSCDTARARLRLPRPVLVQAKTPIRENRDRRGAAAVRRLAALVQLAIAEIETVAPPGPDQESETNGAALIARPDDAIAFVVIEHSRLTRLSFGTHR